MVIVDLIGRQLIARLSIGFGNSRN